MNQITPTPANHDRSRPCLPEAGADPKVAGQRRPVRTAAIGRLSAGRRSLWPAGVRGAAAIVFLIFGVSKFVNHAAELASFRHYPLPAPGTLVYAVGVIEICGGLLLVVGLLTRLTALALAADMLGAIAVSGLARWETVSLTLAPVLLAAMIILTRFGAGDWSLDRHLAANMSHRCAACLLIFSGSPSIRTSADVGRRIERMRRVTWADVTVAWPWRVTTGLAGLGLAGGLGLEGEVEELRWFGQVKGVQHGLLAVRAVP